jgi:hypothetical protein
MILCDCSGMLSQGRAQASTHLFNSASKLLPELLPLIPRGRNNLTLKPLNHKLHIILSVLTGGFWLLIYLPLLVVAPKRSKAVRAEGDAKARVPEKVSITEIEIEKARAKQEKQNKRAAAIEAYKRDKPKNLGYNKSKRGQMYVLSCTHQIRASKRVGILSQGMIGKEVWCDVCNANRMVTAMPYWVQ